jgi:hypothetical protein
MTVCRYQLILSGIRPAIQIPTCEVRQGQFPDGWNALVSCEAGATILPDINQLSDMRLLKKPEEFLGALLGEADGEDR